MGSLLERRTPAQLLWIIGASSALVSIGFAVLAWDRPKGLQPTGWYWLAAPLAALALGLVSSLVAERALQNGINSERWSDSLLDAPRKFTARPVFSVLSGLLLVGAIAYLVFAVSGSRHSGGIWAILWPLMSITRVRSYLRPRPKSDRLFRPIERPKPLQSENWGTPPQPFSN
jgi:hypothetical protein